MLETCLSKVEEHPYEALSYVWGNIESRFKIWVDGCSFTMTGNLFEALWNLWQPYEDRLFWKREIRRADFGGYRGTCYP